MTPKAPKTPIRKALRSDSSLLPMVRDGIGAVENSHRSHFHSSIRTTFADSLELDEATRVGNESRNRWDYLLGHAPSGQVVAVEPHSAEQSEITTVIRKREAAREQLRTHLREGVRITKWLWVASGKVHFANTEKAMKRLDQNGIELVGKVVLSKHLPTPAKKATSTARKSGSRTKQ